ncbi:MAG: glycoside hydrolase family 26 protein, partial [Verrucomicrobiae bacterium]|nr:glycoside hydrolase family 26 protein [Verrucomicrobiae bacterium]
MKHRFVPAFFLVALSALAIEPANRELIPEARKVLGFLESVYERKTLSGMSSYGGWRPVFEVCGRVPAIYGNDVFGWNKPVWGDSYRGVVQRAMDSTRRWWEDKGGIPQLQYHWGKPGDPNGSAWVAPPRGTGPVDVARIITPGTPEHQAAMADLRQTADFMEQLAKARIPVLWRPLHEIDGGWFWWTDRDKPE